MINRSIIITVLTAALTVPAFATTSLSINQTYNSGYSGSTALAFGAADNDFSLSSSEVSATVPVVANPISALYVTSPSAQWISPTENQTDPSNPKVGDPPGTYNYDAQLSTNFLIPTKVTFTGQFASDNAVTLYIGGTQVTSVASPAFQGLTSFTYSLTLGAGSLETPIDFLVTNLDDGGGVNPTGLLVVGLKASAAVPEPGTWLMLFGAATVLVFVQRLRGANVL
jgi:hypothetical protein